MDNNFRRIVLAITLTLVLFFIPTAFANNVEASELSPELQERLSRDIQESVTGTEETAAVAAEELSAEEQALLAEINNNIITVSEGENTIDADVSAVFENELIAESETAVAEIQDTGIQTFSTTSTSSMPDKFRIEPVASVYNVLNNNNDYVSQATGALTYEKTLLSLPGANGLDLNLSIHYNSDDAVLTSNEFADTNETVRKINFNSFAVGWSFGFPTIIKSNVQKNYGWSKETSISFPDGSSYNILNDADNPSSDKTLKLELYKLTDMTLVKKAATNNYELTYTNGTVYTFDGTYGNIIKIKDIYNNEINFYYTELDYYRGSFSDYIYTPSYYSAKINALTKIVDSAGRVINIDYVFNTTSYGKEVERIMVRMDGITYTTLILKRMSNLEGIVDVLSHIIDGEGYATFYNYEEKATHIYNRNINNSSNPSYEVNGSVFVLTKVELPTGGWIKYDYVKSRRAYLYFVPQVTLTDWYEVYKVSKVSDSSGFARTYEYENDRSGYPHSELKIEPIMPDGWYYTGTPTGYVNDKTFVYSCIMREDNKTTVSVFDYMHNKFSEQTYDETNTQNSYITGNGQTKWTNVIGNYVYHMDYIKKDYSSYGRTFLYKQNIISGETILLTPYDGNIYSTAVVKNDSKYIYVFTKKGYSPYTITVFAYNTTTNTWEDAGEINLTEHASSNTIASGLSLSEMYYTDSRFFIWYEYDGVLEHAVYDPSKAVSSRWSYHKVEISSMGSNDTLEYVCHLNNKIYYYCEQRIYEYDLNLNTITSNYFKTLDDYMDEGFTVGERTFISDGDYVCEFNFADGTLPITYRYYRSALISPYLSDNDNLYGYKLVKDLNGNLYFAMQNTDEYGYQNVYRFDPDGTDDKFVFVGSRLISNDASLIYSAGTKAKPVMYFISDGIEKMNLYEPSKPQSTNIVTTKYNSYNQPISNTLTRVNGSQRQDGGTESFTYVNSKSILLSETDILGNKTTYEYTDSPYYIATKVTKFAETDKALETLYTISEDKTKIDSAETIYDDISLKTSYTYGDTVKPGNVTVETLYEASPDKEEYSIVWQKEYGYDTNKALVTSITQKNIMTNDSTFSLSTAQDITVSKTYNPLGLVKSDTDALGRTTHYGYNNNGWNTWKVYPDNSTNDVYYYLDAVYGGLNAITSVQNESYAIVDYFDDLGRQIKQTEKLIEDDFYEQPLYGTEAQLHTYSYNKHNVTKSTDGVGNYSKYTYDSFNRVKSLNKYDSKGSTVSNIGISFDDFDLTRTVNNSGKTTKSYYDTAGRLIKEEVQSDAGIVVTQNFYDHMGNVCRTISPEGDEVIYSYNNRGLLESVTNPDGSVVNYKYDALGNILTVTNAGQVIQTNTYDTLGRLITTKDAMGFEEKYYYDAQGRILKAMDRNGQITSYTYKPNTDYLESQMKGSSEIYFTYDDFGNMLTASNETGTYEYTYKYNNLLDSITTPDDKQISYDYDVNRNIVQVNDYSGDVIDYSYTGLNMIESISRNSELIADYDYNLFGTLNKITHPGQGTTKFIYDDALRLVSQTNMLTDGTVVNDYSYDYDLNGNQITKIDKENTTVYTYDNMNRLTNVAESDGTTTVYTFDNQGNIMTKTVTHPASYEFSFKQNRQDYILSDISTHEFTYAYDKNNRLLMETEHIGGTSDTYTGILEITKQSDYDTNPFKYAGEYVDTCSGLIYLRNRYYDPSIGRFITEDPARDGLNWYVYCENNPINFVDPSGYDAIWITNEDAVSGAGHTSVVLEDDDGDWYYFYWGADHGLPLDTKKVAFELIDDDSALESLDGLNEWIIEKGLPGVEEDENYYSLATYIEGDFSKSADKAKKMYEKWYSGGLYNVLSNNCMQVSTDLINAGSFSGKWWKQPVLNKNKDTKIPNVAKHTVKWLFGNTSFTK